MGWFSSGKKSSKRKLARLVRRERAKDARHARIRNQPRAPRPASKKPHGWFF